MIGPFADEDEGLGRPVAAVGCGLEEDGMSAVAGGLLHDRDLFGRSCGPVVTLHPYEPVRRKRRRFNVDQPFNGGVDVNGSVEAHRERSRLRLLRWKPSLSSSSMVMPWVAA